MIRYLAGRVAQACIVLIGVMIIVFSLRYLSGDPASLLVSPDATREEIQQLSAQMGFDRPYWVQFERFVSQILHGDLGFSWRLQEPALDLVLERIPATFLLALCALFFSLVIAIPIGVLSAVKRNTAFDAAAMVLALVGQSTPVFWLGLMLILVFAVHLGWLPTSGADEVVSVILPSVALGLGLAGRNARLVRSSMLEVLSEDYVRSARAKGLSEWKVVAKHALKNALLPVTTVIGLELGGLLGGAVITESVFGWPGIGLLAYQAVSGGDYPVVQAVILVGALVFAVTNLLVDFLYTRLDPRITMMGR
jgi:ABC-type dipeptide/oligopeptide/nickel transport system permease component